MRLEQIQEIIETKSPLELQEPWDNSGFQIVTGENDIKSILVAMEITGKVIDEAETCGADLIVVHHPMFFNPIKAIDRKDIVGGYVVRLIKKGISVYASHTPFDKCAGGNNDYLANLLDLEDVGVMATDLSGFCRTGYVKENISANELIDRISKRFKIDREFMTFAGNLNSLVKKIGICTGAGGEFLSAAAEDGCDLFVTGDVKYHTAQTAREMGFNLLDIGHYGSEKIFTENMGDFLKKKTGLEVIQSKENLNPFVKL